MAAGDDAPAGILGDSPGVDPEEAILMNPQELIKELSRSHQVRAKLYLHEKHVGDAFAQAINAITDLVFNTQLSAELSGGFRAFIMARLGASHAVGGSIDLEPLAKAILIEYQERKNDSLLDLSKSAPTPGHFLTYSGPGIAIPPGDPVPSVTEFGVGPSEAQRIQSERERQEKIFGHQAMVWMGSAAQRPLASIASDEWVDRGYLASYPNGPHGILGRYENNLDSITTISPLWIWHEGW